MKMQANHVEAIRQGIAPFDTDFYRQRYIESGFSDDRYRWDLFYFAQQKGTIDPFFINRTLYDYCNDNHIDTVLRKLVKPLKG